MKDLIAQDRKTRLFLVSSLAPATAGISASLRANTASDLQRIFFDPVDKAHSARMIAAPEGPEEESGRQYRLGPG